MSDTDTEAFTKCATGNKRKELAERFTQYLKSRDTKDNAYVVNLNGAWGTGKTYFVTEWKKLVEKQGHIAIKIDAWESDYLNDPLAIIIAELLEQIKSNIKNHDARFRNAERNVASAIFNMGKSILPIGSKIVGKHLFGEAATNEILDLIAAATGSVTNHKAVKDDLNIGNLGLEVASQHKRHKQFTQDFKEQARELVDFALEGNPNKQVFIFIDELDRCRPTYAIEMLETVKHLFDIPDFIFVLSTDTNQLQHSIKAVYGHDFDSHEYLSRFFEQRLTLPEPNFLEFLTANNMFSTVRINELNTFPSIHGVEEFREVVNVIGRLNKDHLSLRRLKQICIQLEVVLTSADFKEAIFPIFDLVGIVFGDTLYGGLIEPKTPISRAMMAYKDNGEKSKVIDFVIGKEKVIETIKQLSGGLAKIAKSEPYKFNTQIFSDDSMNFFDLKNYSLNSELRALEKKSTTCAYIVNPQEILNIINSIRIDIEL
ncbi:KAP family P-loop NTPase fold protein [Marinomonas sp.]|uniref:KAP family P-loop NTPase fold protein n=1 Tax=Marinomonas sp. TaxID=1904862 RepID=UPI003BAB960E